MASPKSTLYAVMLVSLLGTAGIALPYPVLAPFFLDGQTSNALTQFLGLPPKLLLGFLLALYPLGILIGSSFIGALSDIYGRKGVLIITLILAALGYTLTGYAVTIESYPLFALARFLTGVCEGNIAIGRAIALDLHPAINRTRAISLLYATTYAGWLVGPLAGGYLMPLGVANVFFVTSVVTVLATILAHYAIVRTESDQETPATVWQAISRNNSIGLLTVSAMRPLIIYHMLFTLGLNAFYEFYPLWLVERFAYDSIQIGWGTVVITSAMILSSIYLVTPIEMKFGTLGTIRRASLLLGLVFMLLPLAGPLSLYPAFLVCGAVIAVANGIFPAYMANNFEQYGQGRVQGLLTTNFCAANVIAAIFGSLIALMGTGWALFSGGLLCACASIWLITKVADHAPAN
jgi:DHA1 family tetracycline resistance protein-like MFS transporter